MLSEIAFGEFDAFEETIAHADVRYRPTRIERHHWSLQFASLSDKVHIQAGSEGSGSMLMGAAQPDAYVLVDRGRSALQRKSNGVEHEPGLAIVLAPGAEFCFVDYAANHWMSISLPVEFVETTDELRWLTTTTGIRRFAASGATEAIWSFAERLIRYARVEPSIMIEPASLAAQRDELLSTIERLGECHPSLVRRPLGRPRKADWQLILGAVELIEDLPHRIVTVRDLVTVTGVPERTLREGFQKYLGVSPRQYIQVSRLCDARRQLAKPASDIVTVTQVAANIGMWDFGRFAHRYRNLFGVLPSQTLAGDAAE